MSDNHQDRLVDIIDAILLLRNRNECENFLKDLCTPQELSAMRERFKVCQILDATNLTYREIQAQTGVSMTTIGKVSRFIRDEPYGGYRLILKRLKESDS